VAGDGDDVVVQAQVRAGESSEETEHVEVSINGKEGPSIKFRIGQAILINSIIGVCSFGILLALMRSDITQLKADSAYLTGQRSEIVVKLSEIQTSISYLREEIRFLRSQQAEASSRSDRSEARIEEQQQQQQQNRRPQ
jgi:septal ring factor EnvC (AmiA/AmiB activator)